MQPIIITNPNFHVPYITKHISSRVSFVFVDSTIPILRIMFRHSQRSHQQILKSRFLEMTYVSCDFLLLFDFFHSYNKQYPLNSEHTKQTNQPFSEHQILFAMSWFFLLFVFSSFFHSSNICHLCDEPICLHTYQWKVNTLK